MYTTRTEINQIKSGVKTKLKKHTKDLGTLAIAFIGTGRKEGLKYPIGITGITVSRDNVWKYLTVLITEINNATYVISDYVVGRCRLVLYSEATTTELVNDLTKLLVLALSVKPRGPGPRTVKLEATKLLDGILAKM